MEFVQRGGRGQTPNPNPNFGSIKKHFGDGLRLLAPNFIEKIFIDGVGNTWYSCLFQNLVQGKANQTMTLYHLFLSIKLSIQKNLLAKS